SLRNTTWRSCMTLVMGSQGISHRRYSGIAEQQTKVTFIQSTRWASRTTEERTFLETSHRRCAGSKKRQIRETWTRSSILAAFYYEGDGVPRDFTRALRWYQEAADQGSSRAQVSLGGLYAAGEGVPKDFVIAYVWFNLAAAQGNGQAKESRDTLEKQMTREQVAEAQRLSSESKEYRQAIRVSPTPSNVRSLDPRIVQTGSGFFITDDGFLLTAAHVVSGLSVSVRTTKGEFPAQIIKVDNANDIALLKVSGMFSFLPLSNVATVG